MFINTVIATITTAECAITSVTTFGMIILTSYLFSILTSWLRNKKNLRRKRRRQFGSCLYTRRKVFWKQRKVTRSEYVMRALQSLNEARTYCEKKTHGVNEGMSKTSCSIMTRVRANFDIRLKADSGGEVVAESTLGLVKAQYVHHSVSKHLEKRGYTIAGRVPFIVSKRWKQRVKKQQGFRRRTGRQREHDIVASGTPCGRIYSAKTIVEKV